ncbi:MAG: WS/DGAT domain-containing protein [Acidimicrobiia bacterium]|nr:WS/DGAT domain-containing protein [Acidimicrobiia bacterium]
MNRQLRRDPLSPTEELMISIERDPRFRSTFANLTVLDGHPDMERLRTRMAETAEGFVRLRQRIEDGHWVEVRDFDSDEHVQVRPLGRKWSPAAVRRRALEVLHEPFPEGRPPWLFLVLLDEASDRAAMVWKLHHAITDGQGGIKMSASLMDASPDATAPLISAQDLRFDHDRAERQPAPGGSLSLNPLRLAERVRDTVRDSAGAARWMAGQAILARGRAPLWNERSMDRAFETLRRPFPRTKQAAANLGVSLNDVLVTAATRGATRVHVDAGARPTRYRMTMPVSTRTDGSAGGNSFSPAVVELPAGVDHPADFHVVEISKALQAVKAAPALGLLDQMAGLANRLPAVAIGEVLGRQVATLDFATSNVRAAPFDLFIAGSHVEANYPIGPLMGAAWNLTLMSYCGSLDMGLHIDRGAVADSRALVRAIGAAFDELLDFA